jgi:hypothetical protein
VRVEELEFRDAAELLDFVRPWRTEHWGSSQGHQWVFRGHATASWPLLPTAWRDGNQVLAVVRMHYEQTIERYLDQFLCNRSKYLNFDTCERRLVAQALTSYIAERELVASFHRAAHRSLGTRRYPLEDYEFCNLALFVQDDHDWADWLPGWGDALAQHYGVPTRLLDWSRNPLAALAFTSFEQKSEAMTPLALWCLDVERLVPSNFAPYTWYLVPDYENNLNARAQGGVLTFVRNAESFFMQHGAWPTHDAAAAFHEGDRAALRKLILPPNQRAVLAKLLLDEGWSLISLKPTLESVARTVLSAFPAWEVASRAGRAALKIEGQYKIGPEVWEKRLAARRVRQSGS